MNGMITVDENYDLDAIIPQLKAYTTGKVVEKVTCREKEILQGDGPKVALLDLGAKRNIARSLNEERMSGNYLSGTDTGGRDPWRSSGRNHAQQRPWRSERNVLLLLKK